MRVLIVDDDKFNRDLVARILEKYSIASVNKSNGREALDYLKKDSDFDAIISDILMPEMDGFALTMGIKKEKKLSEIPVVLYSSTYREEEDKSFASKIGADAFLIKPAPEEKIVATLNEVTVKKRTFNITHKNFTLKRTPDNYKLYSERLINKLERKLYELQEANENVKLAEKESEINFRKYRAVFESANDGILIIERGVITDCNSRAAELFRKEKLDLIGKAFWTLSPDFQMSGKSSIMQFKEKIEEVHRKKQLVFDWSIIIDDKEIIDVEIGLSSFLLNEKTLYLLVIRDLSERKEATLKLKKAYREIQKLKEELESENIYLKSEIKEEVNFENILTRNDNFRRTLEIVGNVARTDSTVLILGETGTGKELIARAIHQLSSRNKKPLIKINCAAIPAQLIESELFGHEKGSFTGAYQMKIGRFEMANEGTLFLDEIGDLPLELQTKLLRVLQEGEIERIGGNKTIKVDVRIITATNRDLEKMMEEGKFRRDLFYRLNVFPIKMPALRERRDDIPLLVEYFVKKYSSKMGKKITSVSTATMNILCEYDWPGNIRELENIIERAVVISPADKLTIGNWFKKGPKLPSKDFVTLEEMEREYISRVLQHCKGKVSGKGGAAEILGLKPTTLQSRLIKLGLK